MYTTFVLIALNKHSDWKKIDKFELNITPIKSGSSDLTQTEAKIFLDDQLKKFIDMLFEV